MPVAAAQPASLCLAVGFSSVNWLPVFAESVVRDVRQSKVALESVNATHGPRRSRPLLHHVLTVMLYTLARRITGAAGAIVSLHWYTPFRPSVCSMLRSVTNDHQCITAVSITPVESRSCPKFTALVRITPSVRYVLCDASVTNNHQYFAVVGFVSIGSGT